MRQEFKPPAIVGSPRHQAVKIAEEIAGRDYNVADMKVEGRQGEKPKVRYKDQKPQDAHQWGVAREALETAMALGRQNRLKHGGDGLDILQRALKDGTQPDLIAESKKRSIKIW